MGELPEHEYRERCLREKGSECVVCGDGDHSEIVVHHVDGNRSNNSIDNLIPVCHQCHAKIHAGRREVKRWAKKLGKPISDGDTTTINISDRVWSHLHSKRTKPGVTFDDVLRRELGLEDEPEVEQ